MIMTLIVAFLFIHNILFAYFLFKMNGSIKDLKDTVQDLKSTVDDLKDVVEGRRVLDNGSVKERRLLK
jgi:cell division protein FtsL